MRTRILRPEEWGRVPTEGGIPALLPFVEPENIAIVVVESDSGEIVASAYALRVTHLEGLWIDPQHRNAGVCRALIRQLFALPRVRGEQFVFGGSADGDERMDSVCERLGGKQMPVKFFAMPVGH